MGTKLVIFLLFIPIVLYCQVIDEGFESGDLGSYSWVLSGDAEWFVTDNVSFEGSYSARGGDIVDNQDTAIEIELEFPQDGILAFAWRVSSEESYDFLQFYLDEVMVTEISGEVAWTQVGCELEAGVHSLRWNYHKDYSVSEGSDTGWIDNVTFFIQEEQYSYDMSVESFSGDNYIYGGESYTYEVVVQNNGQFNATAYTVSLVDITGTEYASETIYWMLSPEEQRLVELVLEPEAATADTLIGLYAYCYLSTDENPDNDYSQEIDVHFAGSENTFVPVGVDSSFTNLLPVNLNSYASICESIYFADELTGTGAISSIDIFNNFANPVTVTEFNVWLGETDEVSLNEGWISSEDLQQVYGGEYTFPAGTNTVSIPLDSLYEYRGNNLVLLIERGYEEGTNSWQSNFYFSEITGNESGRTRFNSSNYNGFDPSVMTDGVVCDWIANTVFTFGPVPFGHISGNVCNEDGDPVINALIEIDNGAWSTYSDSTGSYMIERIALGTHQLQALHDDYGVYTQDIEILSGEILELDIILPPVSSAEEEEIAINGAIISQLYPNPFYASDNRSGVKIEMNLETSDFPAILGIYDIKGRKIVSRELNTVNYNWDGHTRSGMAASGIYFVKLTTARGRTDSARLLLVK